MPSEPLFEYQVDLDNYIQASRVPYDIIAKAVKERLGGGGSQAPPCSTWASDFSSHMAA